MIERAEKIGGSFSIQSKTDAGTVIQVYVPLVAYQTKTLAENEKK